MLTEQTTSARAQPGQGARPSRRTTLLLIAVVVAVVYLFLYPGAFSSRPVFSSPQGNVTHVLTERFADGEGFRQPLLHAERLDPDIARALVPRDAAGDGTSVVPKDFAGPMLLYGVLAWLWQPLAWLVASFAAAAGAVQLVRIVDALPRPGRTSRVRALSIAGTIALLLWIVYPPLMINGSQVYGSDTVSLALMLTAVLHTIKFWRWGRTSDLIWTAVAFGGGVLFRYPNVLLGLPLAISLLATRRVTLRQAGLALAAFLPSVIAILAFNRAVYGAATTTGYSLGAELISDTVNLGPGGLFKFDLAVAASFLRPYVLESPLLLAPPLIGLILGIRHTRRAPERALVLSLLAAAGLIVAFHIGHPAWGRDRTVVNASILRYLLPAAAIGFAFLAAEIAAIRRRRARALLVGLLIAGSLATAIFGYAGIAARARFVRWHTDIRTEVIANTEPDALVASKLADKYLWPDRQTLTLTYLVDNDSNAPLGATRAWDHVPTPERFADVAARVTAAGIALYFLDDTEIGGLLAQYRGALQSKGLRLTGVVPTEPALYRVTPR